MASKCNRRVHKQRPNDRNPGGSLFGELRQVFVGILLQFLLAALAAEKDLASIDHDFRGNAHRAQRLVGHRAHFLLLGDSPIRRRKLGQLLGDFSGSAIVVVAMVVLTMVVLAVVVLGMTRLVTCRPTGSRTARWRSSCATGLSA